MGLARGSTRLRDEYRKANAVVFGGSCSLPRMDDVMDDLWKERYVSKLDLLQGYYQMPLTEKAKPMIALVISEGRYKFCKVPHRIEERGQLLPASSESPDRWHRGREKLP